MIAAPVVSSKPSTKAPRDPLGTINRIFAAAREEFGANGFDGAKVEHIARRAKVSKQLVYLYFNGKDELYSELMKVLTKARSEERSVGKECSSPCRSRWSQ